MKKVYDEKIGAAYECDCAEDWLELITGIAVDYDGERTVEGLKSLIDEIVDYASKARVCLHSGDIFRKEELKPRTHFDEIKAMSVEEMADYIVCNLEPCLYCMYRGNDHSNGYDCYVGVQKWLESEVQEDEKINR